jgi:hypothetical protein
VNVLDHGAVGDGTTLNTAALQKAIAGWHGQTRLTVLLSECFVAQEDTLKLRLGVPPIDQIPNSPQSCRTPSMTRSGVFS